MDRCPYDFKMACTCIISLYCVEFFNEIEDDEEEEEKGGTGEREDECGRRGGGRGRGEQEQ